jgi:pimeloyl-ACP methyl ester carboxylesterase
MESPITPFEPKIEDEAIADLRQRLKLTRYPDEETVEDWSQGIPLAYVRELTDYWADHYDMGRVGDALNHWPNFHTEIEGLDIHFIYQRSPHSEATPLLLTHGWPGSVLEFRHIIDRLSNPTEHGGRAENAFHVVAPALPGYGFSAKPRASGTTVQTIAELWIALMKRLGHEKFLAHGGDWGSLVTQAIATAPNTPCAGIHITLPVVAPDPETMESLLPEEVRALEAFNFYQDWDSGYSKQQSTRPQTLGYGLADSPVGQMAWIIEKYAQWCDCEVNGLRHPENAIARDELLDTVMLYWLTNSGASSARLYWESFNNPDMSEVELSTAISLFPNEIFRSSERWARKKFIQLHYFNDQINKGGHFSALEVPNILAQELWQWRDQLRSLGVIA